MGDSRCTLEVLQRATEDTTSPENYPDYGGWFNSLGIWISSWFKETGSIHYLNYTIEVAKLVIKATREDEDFRAGRLINTGPRLDFPTPTSSDLKFDACRRLSTVSPRLLAPTAQYDPNVTG